ncbi:hypothetical protein Kpol_1027p1, partial [Vanderwaltozyma polyspora DSM 70294]
AGAAPGTHTTTSTTTTTTTTTSNPNNIDGNIVNSLIDESVVLDDDDDDDDEDLEELSTTNIFHSDHQFLYSKDPSHHPLIVNGARYKYKKQRTISLPQLPYAKLLYNTTIIDQHSNEGHYTYRGGATQNDDELLNLTGNSNITLDSNKLVDLTVIRSLSPTVTSDYSSHPIKRRLSSITKYHRLHHHTSSSTSASSSSHSSSRNESHFQTDKDGHYVYKANDIFCDGRFIVKELLGQGTFGKVLKCKDNLDSGNLVAVKVIKAIERYREAAKTELRILQTIHDNDPLGNYQCILLNECFDYKNHICLVTNLYGKSIYDFMCSNAIARFPGSQVQAIARQLIRSVCFLHDLGIIHTDLKPENILLVDDSHYISKQLPKEKLSSLSLRRKNASNGGIHKILVNPEIKIIDFGSAIFYNEYHPPIISTRHYRAPEIILGLGWSYPCDVWSIACVLVELVTGESLYPIHENLEHLAMMQRINGQQLPKKIVEKMFYKVTHKLGNLPADLNTTVVRHFDRKSLTLQWPEVNKNGDMVTTEKSMKRVRDSCDRLDLHISRKISTDFFGDNSLTINWNLSPEQNWNLIRQKLSSYNSHYPNSSSTPNSPNNSLSSSPQNYYYPNSSNINSNGLSSFSSSQNSDKVPLDKETFLFWYWFVDLLKKMFEFDPTKRITAKEALDHEWFNLGILDDGISSFENFLA